MRETGAAWNMYDACATMHRLTHTIVAHQPGVILQEVARCRGVDVCLLLLLCVDTAHLPEVPYEV